MGDQTTLTALLRDAAAGHPDQLAVAVAGGDQLTYRVWEQRSDDGARGLQRRGIVPGDPVALVFDAGRWCDYAVAYLAVHKAGAVAVPLAPWAPPDALERALRGHGPLAVVTPAGPGPFPGAAPLVLPSLEAEGRGHPPAPAPPSPGEILVVPRPLAEPLAVARSPGDVLAPPPWAGGDGGPARLLHGFAPGTLVGQAVLRAALSARPTGGVVVPGFDPERLGLLLASGIPACALHPAAALALVRSGAAGRHDLAGVHRMVLAGARPRPALLMTLTRAFPHAALVWVDVPGDGAGPGPVLAHDRRRPGAVGRASGGTPVEIADDAGRPVAAGAVGWVHAGGAGAPPGTGTRGFLDDDGFLYVATTANEVVRLRGSPRSKAEVRQAFLEHPAVADCAVAGDPDDGSATRLAAAVVLRGAASAEDLRAWVGEHLGADRVPEVVVMVDALPGDRSEAAGALRRALDRPEDAPVSRAGPTPTEETITASWRRVLRCRDVDRDADFFALGGTPVAADAMLDLVEDACGVRVPLDAFADAPTVAGVAAAVDHRRAPAPEAQPAPVAFSQEGMIWHEHFAPGCQNLPGLARRYRGTLDVMAMERAIDEIVRRHEPLRATFGLRRGRLVQTVRPPHRTDLPVLDLRALPAEQREEAVAEQVAEAGRRPFDLTSDALFAATLLRLADDDHVLVIRTHHSVFDDWSVGVFRRELATLYTAFAAGEPSPLAEPPRFTDFARAQRRDLAGKAGTREMAFWRRELEGAPLTAQLPVDDPDRAPGSPQTAGRPVSLSLPPDLHRRLRALAREQRATVFMTMLAAYAVLVHRYTGRDDLLLATVVANRNRTELEGLIGCFTKKVPLRLRLEGDPSFTEALGRARAALLGALTHQDLPFEAVVQDVLGGPAAAHGLAPHVALMFQGETPRRELVLPGLDTTGFETAATARRAHFMADDEQGPPDGSGGPPWGAGLYLGTFVILSVAESDDALSCVARGAFHGPAVRQVLDTYRTLLADVVADPTRPLSALRLLDGPAAANAIARGRGPAHPPPATTLGAALSARIRRDPDAVAVRSDSDAVTCRELAVRTGRLAGRLRSLGAGPGATVGLALGPGIDAVVAAFAVWEAGAAWVGIDPAGDGDRLATVLAQTSSDVVIGPGPDSSLARLARVVAVADDGGAASRGSTAVGPGDVAVVHQGAGSEAVPRGVVLDHRCVLALTASLRELRGHPVGPARRVCLSAPPTADGFLRQLTALLDGHTLCVADDPPEGGPAAAVALVAGGRADVLDCAPGDLPALLGAGLRAALEHRDPAAPRLLLVIGTRRPLDPETWATVRGLGRARTVVLYGVPECTFAATAVTVTDVARPVVGRALPGMQAHVLDTRGSPVPARVPGELHVGGAGLAAGYLDEAPGSEGPLVERMLGGTATRLYRTGQLARRLPDGTVELLGPLDADTDLRGFVVEPARVQSALAGCPGVREVAVTMHRDDSGVPRLVAHVTPDGRPPSLAALRARVWTRLPGYACPSAIVVAGGPAQDPAAATTDPGTAESALLTELWAEAIGAEHAAAGENYWQRFSFLEALAHAREAGLEVTAEQVTRNRTVEMLAADLATSRQAAGTTGRGAIR